MSGENTVRSVRWCYDYELASRDQKNDLLMLSSGMFPYLLRKGKVTFTGNAINLYDKIREENLVMDYDQIKAVYLGYDELYPARLSKNFGAFWSPPEDNPG